MSTDNQNEIRVINEEYERVLGNPENVIVSEALQDLIDMPMTEPDTDVLEAPVDTLTLTILDNDGLAVGVRGELAEVSEHDHTYTIAVDSDKVRKEFLEALTTKKNSDESGVTLMLGGLYNSEILDANILAWSVERPSPHSYRFTVKFRSENGIF
tara:strand:- start:1523 stop:1987 length:465 start_codon:yes stop_codon:yes gene_type:complete